MVHLRYIGCILKKSKNANTDTLFKSVLLNYDGSPSICSLTQINIFSLFEFSDYFVQSSTMLCITDAKILKYPFKAWFQLFYLNNNGSLNIIVYNSNMVSVVNIQLYIHALYLTETIRKALNNSKSSMWDLCWSSKTFDTVNNEILLYKFIIMNDWLWGGFWSNEIES